MKRKYLLECGCLVDPGKPCYRHNCGKIVAEINGRFDHLEGRKAILKSDMRAHCTDHAVKSAWTLPGFLYRPDSEYDLWG